MKKIILPNPQELLDISNASKEVISLIIEIIEFCRKPNSHPDSHLAELTCAKLLAKIRNDLQCIDSLVVNGNPLQAATIASSLQECFVLISYIGNDNIKAEEFWNHSKEKVSFGPLNSRGSSVDFNELAESVVLNFFSDTNKSAEYVEHWKETYTFFCQAKHNNPRVIRYFYGDRTEVTFDSYDSKLLHNVGITALFMSLNFSMQALKNFLFHFQPANATPRRIIEINSKSMNILLNLENVLPKIQNLALVPKKDTHSA